MLMSLHPESTDAKLYCTKALLHTEHTVKVLYFQVAIFSFLIVPEHHSHRDPDILEINHEVSRTLDWDKLEQFSISPKSSNWITTKVLVF